MTYEVAYRNTDDALSGGLLVDLAELVAGLGGAVIRVDQARPDGLEEGQELALIVRPDATSERFVYTDLASLTDAWAAHLGARTERVGAGVVALEVAPDVMMWARVWEPDEYDLDTLVPNVAAGFIFWMANDHHHVPVFGPVLLTGQPHSRGVYGLGADDLAMLEKVATTERDHGADEGFDRDALAERFRESARDGLMFQDTQAIRENGLLGAPPCVKTPIRGETELIVEIRGETESIVKEDDPAPTAAAELWEWRNRLIARADGWYPESVFIPARPGEPYQTQDAAAAAMARHILRLIADELGERSVELDGSDDGSDDDDERDVSLEEL